MGRRGLSIIIATVCLGLLVTGCPKKTALKDQPTALTAAEAAAERERQARLEAERKDRESREAKRREEEARRREEEARKKVEAQKEFEKSLVAKKTPGIEGTVFETKLLKDIYFDFDKYDVRPADTDILKETAAQLMKYPKVKIQIEGHCDERGTSEYNLALGERRANSVKKYLISLGVPGDRISTISYGEERPADPAHTDEAWSKNRRAHFVVLSM